MCIAEQDATFWGPHEATLQSFLRQHATKVAALEDESWFADLLHDWGRPFGQHDCAEFLGAFLTWMDATAFNHSWEQRVENEGSVQVVDRGSQFMPIVLQFDMTHDQPYSCSLSKMFLRWHQVHGMRTALSHPAALLCVHVDRLFQDDQGAVCKCQLALDLDVTVDIPCFLSNQLRTELATYQVIAAASHLGSDEAGHYRCALRLRDTYDTDLQPVRWLLTQDDESPSTVWHLPDWMKQGVTAVWLAREDSKVLPDYVEVKDAADLERRLDGVTAAELIQLLQSNAFHGQ